MHVDLEYFIGSTSTICGCIIPAKSLVPAGITLFCVELQYEIIFSDFFGYKVVQKLHQ